MTQTSLPTRSQVPVQKTWNLESIFPNIDAWESALMQVNKDLPKLETYMGKLGDSPETLLEYLNLSQEITILAMKVMVYSGLDQSADMADPDKAARAGQGQGLMAKLSTVRAFEEPELMEIGLETLKGWARDNQEFSIYKQYLDDLQRQAAHVRSSEIEEILAMISGPLPYSTPPFYGSLN